MSKAARRKPGTRGLSINELPEELVLKFKMYCAQYQFTQQEVIELLVTQVVDGGRPIALDIHKQRIAKKRR